MTTNGLWKLNYGDFMCVKCMAVKDSEFANLGCGTKAAKSEAKRRETELQANLEDAAIRCAIHHGYSLEKRLWPRLRKELNAIYRRATSPSPGL